MERVFRRLKSGLMLRPVYHWKESRARGHVMVCFLAFVLETALRRRLTEKGTTNLTATMRGLTELHAVEIDLDGRRYVARTDLTKEAALAFQAVGRRPPDYIAELA